MATIQGWGRQTWNSGAWNTFAPVEATGNGLTSTVGSVSTITTNIFGVTGIQLTSTIGDATQASEYAVTGNAVTTSLGTMPNPTIVDNQLLTGWNRGVGTSVPLGWNAASWGNGDFILSVGNGLSGASMTSSLGEESPTGNADITATGLPTTSTVGTAVATGVAVANATGNPITSSLGTETVTGSCVITPTGLGMTSSLGDETASGVFQSGWNRGAAGDTGTIIGWSDNLWNITEQSYPVTGNSLTSNTGSMSFRGDVAPTITGVQAASAASTPGTSVFVTGVQSTSSIGTFSITGDSQVTGVAASEPKLDASVGTVEADPEFVVFPSGNAMTSAVGTVGTSVFVTGLGTTLSLGDETQETSYEAPSVALTSNVGTVSIRTDVAFTITGNSVTSSLGNLQGTFWSEVDDSNSDISWTEVHKAA